MTHTYASGAAPVSLMTPASSTDCQRESFMGQTFHFFFRRACVRTMHISALLSFKPVSGGLYTACYVCFAKPVI